jgi:hypothetical protein
MQHCLYFDLAFIKPFIVQNKTVSIPVQAFYFVFFIVVKGVDTAIMNMVWHMALDEP